MGCSFEKKRTSFSVCIRLAWATTDREPLPSDPFWASKAVALTDPVTNTSGGNVAALHFPAKRKGRPMGDRCPH